MTTYEMNAWVAEHVMGWEYQENPHGWRLWFPLGKGKIQKTVNDDSLPSFSTDRNLCAQAEAKIAEMGLGKKYAEMLGLVVWGKPCLDTSRQFQVATASAHQRCEAMYEIRERIAGVEKK